MIYTNKSEKKSHQWYRKMHIDRWKRDEKDYGNWCKVKMSREYNGTKMQIDRWKRDEKDNGNACRDAENDQVIMYRWVLKWSSTMHDKNIKDNNTIHALYNL